MKKTGFLLIGAAVLLGAFGITMPEANRTALMSGAGIFLLAGLFLLLIGALIESKKKELMLKFQGVGGTGGIPTDFEIPEGFDPQGILKTVMDAQSQSGGDPEELAKILQQQFGGDTTIVEGDSQIIYGGDTPGGHPSVGGAADQTLLLAQLSELRDKGILTDEQFETQKNRLLS